MKRLGTVARRVAQTVLWRILHRRPLLYQLLPRILQGSKLDVLIGRTALPLARNPLYRAVQLLLRNGRAYRPLASIAVQHRRFYQERPYPYRINRFFIKKRISAGVVERIRDVFSTNVRYNADLARGIYPNNIDGYEIGHNIGYGCNAAVYALKVREVELTGKARKNLSTNLLPQKNRNSQNEYPLALKLMYNFALDMCPRLGDNYLWRSMGAELVPLPGSGQLLNGRMGSYRPLPDFHPNVVRVLTAFVDRMPILEDAKSAYPDALPNAPFYEMIINEPRTMFIVMKRYRMTLRDYLVDLKRKCNDYVARVLFGQLLEGCVFLYDNVVAQRDMKSDNILLEFDDPDEVPRLVISDFGCALAKGSWIVKYADDAIDLGGNRRTRAPEIVTAQPGPDCLLDFRMADTWAAGALGYEIFTRVNPFYSRLDSAKYKEEELPLLPRLTGRPVCEVIRNLLKRDPAERLLPHIGANVICLSLLRLGGDFQSFLTSRGFSNIINPVVIHDKSSTTVSLELLNRTAEKVLDDVLFLMSAETMASRASPSTIISKAERQLRATFLSRLNRDHVWKAASYFLPKQVAHNGTSDGNHSSLAAAVDKISLGSGVVHRCSSLILY
ncbi:unnamed protein product [Cylicocyclus nassatus]|uniref:non-specific serine/threonine protein kinase n=1 Tax=Cylicocyclus nassatus TaxID=53992 RepID=A0AA36ME83_CYLNA|nr:unnamed protein product [Cylicocyclus nassatus]